MNGNSKMGFGGAVEVFGPVDVTFINCEFGGSISELPCPAWQFCLCAPPLMRLPFYVFSHSAWSSHPCCEQRQLRRPASVAAGQRLLCQALSS